jgi:hypothetical protein
MLLQQICRGKRNVSQVRIPGPFKQSICAAVLCIIQVTELQEEILALRAAQASTPRSPAAAPAATAAADKSPGSPEQHLQQQQLTLSMAADNARLAVALAELMEELDMLQQQQSYGSNRAMDVPELRQQRLQLLVSQLVVARDQAAGAANLSELQQEQLVLQQQQLAQAAADVAAMQQQYAQLQRQHLQQAQAAVVAAVMAAAEPGSAAVAQVRLTIKHLRKLNADLLRRKLVGMHLHCRNLLHPPPENAECKAVLPT